jgi:hypothetical protein
VFGSDPARHLPRRRFQAISTANFAIAAPTSFFGGRGPGRGVGAGYAQRKYSPGRARRLRARPVQDESFTIQRAVAPAQPNLRWPRAYASWFDTRAIASAPRSARRHASYHGASSSTGCRRNAALGLYRPIARRQPRWPGLVGLRYSF